MASVRANTIRRQTLALKTKRKKIRTAFAIEKNCTAATREKQDLKCAIGDPFIQNKRMLKRQVVHVSAIVWGHLARIFAAFATYEINKQSTLYKHIVMFHSEITKPATKVGRAMSWGW